MRWGKAGRVSGLAMLLLLRAGGYAGAQIPGPTVPLSGTVRDGNGAAIAGARVLAAGRAAVSDASGRYEMAVPKGLTGIEVRLNDESRLRITLDVEAERRFDITLKDGANVTVRGDADAWMPDPATQGFSRSELLEANPGRPGVPLSVPGYPAETASGGIKAPQYFAPGVAGDHGEPIAQFLQVGDFLFQNNLTANAHGNGYADPNFIIGAVVGGVAVDNAGYNARYGDHSINLAVTYQLRDRLGRFVQAATDGRDGALTAGWSPASPAKTMWIAAEGMVGNGFLRRAEERQQYKLNGLRAWTLGRHQVTALGLGYYGFSRIPGLTPIGVPVPGDTIDQRQLDLTHTGVALLTDHWLTGERSSLTTGVFFRSYGLRLQSNFGEGLLRQSEFRTVEGASATYALPIFRGWLLLAGGEYRRDAPRGLDLAKADDTGRFQLMTSNDLTITSVAPFAALTVRPVRGVQLYLGLRRDQVRFNNRDRLEPGNSFEAWPGTTSPKVNVVFGGDAMPVLPQVALSYGEAFHANDPRIGAGTSRGSLLIKAREYQMFVTKRIVGSELRLTLARVANSAELAKIDADTGLQENVGPSVNRFLTLAVRRRVSRGFFQVAWSEADARERSGGGLIPEAPRMLVDAIGSVNRLPRGFAAQAEFEYVKAKPLGDGISGVPLREIRLAMSKSFVDGRWQVGINGQLNRGYTGQTLETLAVGVETMATERPVGVPSRSYAAVTATYSFGR